MSKSIHFSGKLPFSYLQPRLKRGICQLLLLLIVSFHAVSQDQKTHVDLVFMGDIMQHSPQIRSAYNPAEDNYDYTSCFRYIEPSIKEADLAIANLEVTLAGKPFSGYPTFSSPDELAVAAKNAGIDILITGNNHSLDRRKKRLERTIDVLDSLSIPHTGTFKNADERTKTYPLIVEKKGMKIAFLNYTYGTNGIPVTEPNIVNYIDTAQIKADLQRAKELESDFTIVIFHWGYEYNRLPNDEQKMLTKFSKAHGADMVIGAHPHVLQPMEFQDGFLTVYSLGNFVSNQRDQYKDGGLIAKATLEFDEKTREVKVIRAAYQLVWVYKKSVGSKSEYYILPADDYLSRLRIFDEEDREKMRLFVTDSRELFAANNKGYIPEYRYVFSYMPSYAINGQLFNKHDHFWMTQNLPAPEKKPAAKVERGVSIDDLKKENSSIPAQKVTPVITKKHVYRIQFFVTSSELETSELSGKHQHLYRKCRRANPLSYRRLCNARRSGKKPGAPQNRNKV